MPLFVLGISHNTAPVDIREQMTFGRDQLAEALADLRGLDGVEEAVVLSTCNRTEIYAQTAPDAGR
ncbi:MAG: glutamyl-tRNA reductase, partial [Gammaproteobacteria bacterium]